LLNLFLSFPHSYCTIDEEALVRSVRLYNELHDTIKYPSALSGLRTVLHSPAYNQQHTGTNRVMIEKASHIALHDSVMIREAFEQFLQSGEKPYISYIDKSTAESTGVFFGILHLHPLDVVVTLRPSPSFPLTTAEIAILSLLSHLTAARFTVGALIAQHAFGNMNNINDVLNKHYRAALWRQVHRLLGGSIAIEDSVGLVANLGTGVYDLLNEPIDAASASASGEEGGSGGSFLHGLSKGGKSLASRTIGNLFIVCIF